MSLTTEGLVTRRFPEIQKAIQDAMKTSISNELSFDEDTILGQIVDILSAEISVVEETVQAIYNSLDRDKSEGAALDSLLYLIGLTRLGATTSKGFLEWTTAEGVTIPFGALAENPSSSERFTTLSATLSTIASCRQARLEVVDVLDSTEYTITVDEVSYSFTTPATGTTAGSVVAGLVGVVNADLLSSVTATSLISPDSIVLTAKNDVDVSVSVLAYLEPFTVKIKVAAESLNEGSIKATPNTITKVVTAIGGVINVTNNASFGLGRLRETDEEFKFRATQSLAVSGSATYPAMLAAMLAVEQVSTVTIEENSTGGVVDGRPAKSFEVIVSAPVSTEVDQAIATTIWNEKPIGIETVGNTAVTIIDGSSTSRIINFSRPTEIYIAVRVSYTLYDEELFPAAGETLIRESILATASLLTNGEDVIPKRFIGPLYAGISGLEDVTVEVQTIPTPTSTPSGGSWSENKIAISSSEVSNFPAAQVAVQGV